MILAERRQNYHLVRVLAASARGLFKRALLDGGDILAFNVALLDYAQVMVVLMIG